MKTAKSYSRKSVLSVIHSVTSKTVLKSRLLLGGAVIAIEDPKRLLLLLNTLKTENESRSFPRAFRFSRA